MKTELIWINILKLNGQIKKFLLSKDKRLARLKIFVKIIKDYNQRDL